MIYGNGFLTEIKCLSSDKYRHPYSCRRRRVVNDILKEKVPVLMNHMDRYFYKLSQCYIYLINRASFQHVDSHLCHVLASAYSVPVCYVALFYACSLDFCQCTPVRC